MEKEPQYEIEGVDDKKLKKKNENEEKIIGLQKCSLANITKNGVEKEWPSSFSFLLFWGVRQQTSSLSLSLFLFLFSLNFGIVLQWIPPIICLLFFLFIVFFSFTSYLEVFTTKHPLSLLFFFIILVEKLSKGKKKKKKISKKKEKRERRTRNKRCSLVNTSKNEVKKRIILFLFLLGGVHKQASTFLVFLHYNEYLLFTFFSSSYSSYFLFFSTSCLEVSESSSFFLLFSSLHFWRINISHLLLFFFLSFSFQI